MIAVKIHLGIGDKVDLHIDEVRSHFWIQLNKDVTLFCPTAESARNLAAALKACQPEAKPEAAA